jgi:hypothetical protein
MLKPMLALSLWLEIPGIVLGVIVGLYLMSLAFGSRGRWR